MRPHPLRRIYVLLLRQPWVFCNAKTKSHLQQGCIGRSEHDVTIALQTCHERRFARGTCTICLWNTLRVLRDYRTYFVR